MPIDQMYLVRICVTLAISRDHASNPVLRINRQRSECHGGRRGKGENRAGAEGGGASEKSK